MAFAWISRKLFVYDVCMEPQETDSKTGDMTTLSISDVSNHHWREGQRSGDEDGESKKFQHCEEMHTCHGDGNRIGAI